MLRSSLITNLESLRFCVMDFTVNTEHTDSNYLCLCMIWYVCVYKCLKNLLSDNTCVCVHLYMYSMSLFIFNPSLIRDDFTADDTVQVCTSMAWLNSRETLVATVRQMEVILWTSVPGCPCCKLNPPSKTETLFMNIIRPCNHAVSVNVISLPSKERKGASKTGVLWNPSSCRFWERKRQHANACHFWIQVVSHSWILCWSLNQGVYLQ